MNKGTKGAIVGGLIGVLALSLIGYAVMVGVNPGFIALPIMAIVLIGYASFLGSLFANRKTNGL